MKVYLDCYPCFVRQALDAARFATDDVDVQQSVLKAVVRAVADFNMSWPPPVAAQIIHRIVRELTGLVDPYAEAKRRCNRIALDMYGELEEIVGASSTPLETAARIAIAGNIIDFGVKSEIDVEDVRSTVEHSLACEMSGNEMNAFREAVAEAETILYLADNAGEIVFDRLLIEQLPADKLTVAVRGLPVINDATLQDARVAGITEIANVIDNGSDAPATILEDCSERFLELFERAELVIAKGQGNYETLSDIDKNIFFLLKAKCPVIARHIGCEVGEVILRRNKIYSGVACTGR